MKKLATTSKPSNKNKKMSKNNEMQSVCLICSVKGLHVINVINPNTKASASGTPLSKLLNKVIGETLCYSISKFICHQCFILLDRLDAYEARAAEIHSHIKDRYKDTKLKFVKSNRWITKLIESSLTNIKKYENGTTLNLSSELSVTVFHDVLPSKNSKPSKHTKKSHDTTYAGSCHIKEDSANNNYLKRKPTSLCSKNSKKRKISSTNNNGLDDPKDVVCDLSDKVSYGDYLIGEGAIQNNNIDDESCSDDVSHSSEDCSCDSDDGNIRNDVVNHRYSSMLGNNKKRIKDTRDDANGKVASENISNCKDLLKKSGEINVTQLPTKVKPEYDSMNEPEDVISTESQPDQKDEGLMTLDSHIAQAVLLQNSFASNLLQSFLSTSMWMNSSESTGLSSKNQKDSSQNEEIYHSGEIVTADSLYSNTELNSDKKTRLELKNTGRSYINTKGALIDAKKILPQDCSRCPLKCNQRISEEMRVSIFASYWGLGDYDLQRKYMASHMEREERVGPSGYARIVILYYLTHEDTKIQVCRQFFLKTLDVSEKTSRIVLKKKRKGEL